MNSQGTRDEKKRCCEDILGVNRENKFCLEGQNEKFVPNVARTPFESRRKDMKGGEKGRGKQLRRQTRRKHGGRRGSGAGRRSSSGPPTRL